MSIVSIVGFLIKITLALVIFTVGLGVLAIVLYAAGKVLRRVFVILLDLVVQVLHLITGKPWKNGIPISSWFKRDEEFYKK